MRIRCTVCGLPVYALYLLEPTLRKRLGFEALSRCPYCFDDGTGGTGDASRVDRSKETRAAIHRGVVALLLFIGFFAVAFVFALMGWLPGYGRG
jgi:hypothetical protein